MSPTADDQEDYLDGASIQVVCREDSHAGREVKVATFVHLPRVYDGQAGLLEVSAVGMTDERLDTTRLTGAQLQSDTGEHVEWIQHGHPGVRTRYSMRCRLCGLNPTAREERLHPILQRLLDNGTTVVTLRLLASLLG